jgi:hypothetical protein
LVLDRGNSTLSSPIPSGRSINSFEGFSVSENFILGSRESTSVEGSEFFVGQVRELVESQNSSVSSSVPGEDSLIGALEDVESEGFSGLILIFLGILKLPRAPESLHFVLS